MTQSIKIPFTAEDARKLGPKKFNQLLMETLKDYEEEKIVDFINNLQFNWDFWARPEQRLPESYPINDPNFWAYWLILAGRGFGKTRVGAETIKHWALSGKFQYCNLIGATTDDARQIMIQGESGILNICNKDERPIYKKQDRELVWPNGAKSLIFTADEPERLRGKQHSKLWCDEMCSWRYLDAWDMAIMGLRLDSEPQAVITTTPKPSQLIKTLINDPLTKIARGSTFANKDNLAKNFISSLLKKYEGTRLGRQELDAELLTDNPSALWTDEMLFKAKPNFDKNTGKMIIPSDFDRIVIALDPTTTGNPESDECGIIVAAKKQDKAFILEDASILGPPSEWAKRAVEKYEQFECDVLVYETNQGGLMVEETIKVHRRDIKFKGVHASKSKMARAEPVAALYEKSLVYHCGNFTELEAQLKEYVPGSGKSPDRLDALVWALTELMLQKGPSGVYDYLKEKAQGMHQDMIESEYSKAYRRLNGVTIHGIRENYLKNYRDRLPD